MINELAQELHQNNKDKGFYDKLTSIPEKIALIHSEASEALEAHRKQIKPDAKDVELIPMLNDVDYSFKPTFENRIKGSFPDELADIVIRVLDLAAHEGIDIEGHIKAKVRYNTLRPYMHGDNKQY